MAARKKKAPARKAARKAAPAAKKRAPRALPNDDAWRALVETAVEQRAPAAGRESSGTTAKPAARKKARKK